MSGEVYLRILERECERREEAYKADVLARIEQYLESTVCDLPDGSSAVDYFKNMIQSVSADQTLQLASSEPPTESQWSGKIQRTTKNSPHSRKELFALYKKISFLDEHESKKVALLIDDIDAWPQSRMDAVVIQMKLTLGRVLKRIADDICYRQKLRALHQYAVDYQVGAWLAEKIQSTLENGGYLSRFDYVSLIQQCRDQSMTVNGDKTLEDGVIRASLMQLLKQQGYELYDENGKAASAQMPRVYAGLDMGADYYAMITDTDGGVSLRLARVVGKEEDLEKDTEAQRQKDHEATKKWCAYCADLERRLNGMGIPINLHIKRNESAEILVLVNSQLSRLPDECRQGVRHVVTPAFKEVP